MAATWFFYAGMGIDAIVLLMMMLNLLVMTMVGGIDGIDGSPAEGLSSVGWAALWLLPLLLLALMGAAHRLKTRGAMLVASLLLWLPALPFLGGVSLWGGLAVVFVLFGR